MTATAPDILTERERTILRLRADGLDSYRIADSLSPKLKPVTVRFHLSQISKKVGVHGTELVALAAKWKAAGKL